MAKEKFERNKPHVNVGTIGHVDVYHIQLTGSLVKPGDREPGAFYTLYKFPQK